MKAVFADTFCWVALTNPDDTRYRDAVAFDEVLEETIVFTTDEVLVEFLSFFSADADSVDVPRRLFAASWPIRKFGLSSRIATLSSADLTCTKLVPTRDTAS